jgi:hypothetical protein
MMADMWHIPQGGQRQSTQLMPNATGFQEVWEITYVIDSGPATGTSGTVTVPAAFYNADYVKQTIDQAVAHVDAVAGL